MAKHYVYVLRSLADNQFYVGLTDNLRSSVAVKQRHHINESVLQDAVKRAVRASGIRSISTHALNNLLALSKYGIDRRRVNHKLMPMVIAVCKVVSKYFPVLRTRPLDSRIT